MIDRGRHGLRPLGELAGSPEEFSWVPSGCIEPRGFLVGSRYGPGANLAVEVSRRPIEGAELGADELNDAWLMVGSSRGNAAGWVDPWPGRRRHRLMSTSNSMHSEVAAAVSIEYGIRGPYHVISNGCASGLDAIGLAYLAVSAGIAPRAMVVSLDLPLVPTLLRSYAETGLLSRDGTNDPYSPSTTGFLPAEGAAALLLEPSGAERSPLGYIHGYWANSDAFHPLGIPADGRGIADCVRQGIDAVGRHGVVAVCPHASGTHAHGQAERRALATVFPDDGGRISLHLLKPFTGHTVGASGAIDVAILMHYQKQGLLPPNLPGLTGAGGAFSLPTVPTDAAGRVVLKVSVGLGGRNAVVALSRERRLP